MGKDIIEAECLIVGDLVWSVEPQEFGLLAWNRNFEEHFRRRGVVLSPGMKPEDVFPPQAREAIATWRGFYVRAAESGGFRQEYQLFGGARLLDLTFERLQQGEKPFAISVFGKDITESKAAEPLEEETPAWYREIFENALQGICRTSLDGRVLAANPTFARMAGYGSARELMDSVTDVARELWMDPAERRKLTDQLEELGFARGYESRLRRRDGSPVWVAISARLVRDRSGAPLFFESCVEDIGGRKRAEEALRRSENRFRALFEDAPLGIALVDEASTRFLEANAAYCRIIGRSPEQIPALSFPDFSHPDDVAGDFEVFERIKAGEIGGLQRDKRYLRPDGSIVWARITVTRLCEEGGAPVHLAMVEDITARKLMEEALRKSEEKFATVFRCSPAAIVISDQNREGRLLDVSDAFGRLTGYGLGEVLGVELWADREERQTALRQLSKIGRLENFEMRFRCKSGEVRTGLISAQLIEIDGKECVLSATLDVTEHKRAEQAMRESAAKFRAVVENGHDGILFVDANATILYRSPSYELINGFRNEERLGQNGFETVHPDDLERIKSAWRALLQDPEHVERLNYRIRHKSGSWVSVDTAIQNLLENPDVRAIVVSTRDVTEREKVEHALREREAQYRLLAENVSDVIWVIDPEARALRYVSPSVERLLGFSAAEIMRLDPLSTVPAEWAEFAVRVITERIEAFRNGAREVFTDEVQHARRDGRLVWVECRSRFAVNEKTGRLEIYGVTRDISARKRAEEELELSQTKLQEATRHFLAVAKCVPDMIWSMDLEGRFTYVSAAVERLYGYTVEEFLTLTRQDTSTPEQFERSSRIIQQELESAASPDYDRSRIVKLETERVRKDGTRFWAEVNTSLVWSDDGKPVGWTGISRDVTDRKHAEAERERLWAQLAQAQKMESVGRLAGGVAHDFNNLLTVINGYSKNALTSMAGTNPLREPMEEIHHAGERAAALTRQLLAFSRKQILQPQVLDLNRIVGAMRSMLRRLMGEDVEVRFTPCRETFAVMADPHQLEQVVMNLAVNARDAMPAGGVLQIETRLEVRCDESATLAAHRQPRRYAVLDVSDTGSGMETATKERIFEPFFTTKEPGRGTGLGLSTVQGIVEQSGGFLQVETEKGKGSSFRIFLPALEVDAGNVVDVARKSTGGGKETILLVEDQHEVRKFVLRTLVSFGYDVLDAADGPEALAICVRDEVRIDLLLTDLVMPQMNGRELAARVLAMRPGVGVLFMSGYTDDVVARHGISEGADFIQKPFEPGELGARIRGVLSRTAGRR